MPFTKQHSAYAWVVTCILFLINLTFHNLPLHSSYKIHQPITDYFLRLPYSELLEKRLFRSRANRRLVHQEDRHSPGQKCGVPKPCDVQDDIQCPHMVIHHPQADGDVGQSHESASWHLAQRAVTAFYTLPTYHRRNDGVCWHFATARPGPCQPAPFPGAPVASMPSNHLDTVALHPGPAFLDQPLPRIMSMAPHTLRPSLADD